jgi:MFS family permease
MTEGRRGEASAPWLLGLSAMLFLMLVPFSCYVVALPVLSKEWAMGNTVGAVVFSSYLIGTALASLFVVPLADRLPLRPLLLASVAACVLSHLVFPLLAEGIVAASLLRVLAGAGHAGAYVLGIRLVADRCAGIARGRAVGLFVSFGFAGTTLSYLFMGEAMARLASWREAYFAIALASVPSVLLAVLLARAREDEGHGLRRGSLDPAALRERPLVLLTIAYALHAAELYVARLWFPALLAFAFTSEGASSEDAMARGARLAGLMFTLGVPAVFLGGALSDRLGRTTGAAVIFGASGVLSLLAGSLWQFPALLIALGFLYGFATAADSAIYSTAVAEVAPRAGLGSAQAVQSFAGFAVGAVAPVVAGSILDAVRSSQGWALAFGFNAALAVPAVLCLLWLRRLPEAVRMAAGKR